MAETLERSPAESLHPHPDAPAQVPKELEQNVLVTSLDTVLNWARGNSLWPFPLGTA
jgi:NADH:ubiquinone oxidoreductase subunit B-like Fe-S oxidoreductase